MAANSVTATLTAENTFSEWLAPKIALSLNDESAGFLNISVSAIGANTVTLQRRFGATDTERDVYTFVTNDVEESLYDHEVGVEYRIGIKTGNYSAGTTVVRLGA